MAQVPLGCAKNTLTYVVLGTKLQITRTNLDRNRRFCQYCAKLSLAPPANSLLRIGPQPSTSCMPNQRKYWRFNCEEKVQWGKGPRFQAMPDTALHGRRPSPAACGLWFTHEFLNSPPADRLTEISGGATCASTIKRRCLSDHTPLRSELVP